MTGSRRNELVALAALLLATFMGFLDLFIVNVAAPSIQRELPASFAQLQLVLSGYIVAYAAGLVAGGRLGDAFGRRRLWLIGVAAFIVTSTACGLAPSAAFLIGARVAQGFTAALMLPQVLASIQVLFTGEVRARALGGYGAVIGFASLSGQLVGGLLIGADVAGTGWRSVFFVNVPLGLVALAVGARTIPDTSAERPQPVDLVGVALLGVALVSLLYPAVTGPGSGWSTTLIALIFLGCVTAAGFVLWERRLEGTDGREPLIRPSLFGEPVFRCGLFVVVAFYAGNSGFFLVLAYFLQSGLHSSAVASGIGFLPLGAGFMISSLASRSLVARWGMRVLLAGALLIMIGLVLVAVTLHGPHAFAQLLGPLLLTGLGEGLIAAPVIGIVLQDIDADIAGAASGALLTTTQIANILSVAVTGSIFSTILGDRTARSSFDRAFTGSVLWLIALTLALVALLLVLARAQSRAPTPVGPGLENARR